MSHTTVTTHYEAPTHNYKYLKSFLSGGLAGMAAKTFIAPLDRVKILFQTSHRAFTYKEGLKEGLSLYNTQGYRGLWKGNGATLIRIFPYTAIQFGMFDFFQAIISRPDHSGIQKNVNNFIAGSLAGICATTLTYPAEFLRTRMAMDIGKYGHRTLTESASSIYRREGLRVFYHGVGPSLVGIVPYHGIGFFMFHYLKGKLQAGYPEWKHNKIADFSFGAIGGCVAQLVAYPFDIIRKKMQAQNLLIERGEIRAKMGAIKWTKHILMTEGLRGIYKGYTMHFVKAPLANGTCFAVKNMLNRRLDSGFKH